MQKVLVIGGGPSGMVASIFAKNKYTDVTVMERNSSCGKKLLLTGNGKCNYWNDDLNINHFHSETPYILKDIFTEKNMNDTFHFLESIGIIPFIKNGYYYPFSNQSVTMKNALMLEAKKKRVQFIYDIYVKSIRKEKDQFIVSTNKGEYIFDFIILATGSKAVPRTGSDGNGYELLKDLGHFIVPINPSLVQLELDCDFLNKWHGIRTNVKVSLYDKDTLLKEESGEIQLTDYGVSGICIFNLSRFVASDNVDKYLVINFLPFIKENPFDFFEKLNHLVKNRTIGELLENILNYKLVLVLLHSINIDYNKFYEELSNYEKEKLITTFTNFKVKVVKTKDFDHAQVCSGGLSLSEINFQNMESKLVNHLFVVGELLDIDGDCGGYNLINAFVTGMLAGKGISNDKN